MTAALVAIGVAAVVAIAAVARRRRPTERRMAIDPFAIGEPWRRYVSSAQAAQRRYTEIVAATPRRTTPGQHGIDHPAGATRGRGVLAHRQARRRARRCPEASRQHLAAGCARPRDRRRTRGRRCRPSSIQRSESAPPATTPTNGCGCSTPASASSSRRPRRSASAPTRRTIWEAPSTTSSPSSRRFDWPSKTSTTRARVAQGRHPHRREQLAALERHGRRGDGGLAHHRAGQGRRVRHRPQPRPGDRRLRPGQRHPEHDLRTAARRCAVGDARAAVHPTQRGRRRRRRRRRSSRSASSCSGRSPCSPCWPRR